MATVVSAKLLWAVALHLAQGEECASDSFSALQHRSVEETTTTSAYPLVELNCTECSFVCCYSRFPAPPSLCGCLDDCGASCSYCEKPYFARPDHYEVPDVGGFSIPIHVPDVEGLTAISQLEVGLGLAGFELLPLQITLIGPASEEVRLKDPSPSTSAGETGNNATLPTSAHWVFSDRDDCGDCLHPVGDLSTIQGSPEGNWTIKFEEPEVAVHNGLVTWVELSIKSC
mmetsp:Transcript_36797/g.68497  ORF Transcript_36797/g.68497 Transcript_36797/m.68497 type:complete len:229 (+) Transcript_36797:34-720(+)